MPNRRRAKPAPTCSSTRTTRSTGIRGAKKRSRRARRENKPILLSIGYSACHWCHVMAHESFEDADVAALMNDLFVNVKGRSRGAAGSRPDLPDRACDAHATDRRLAADDVPDARSRSRSSAAPIFPKTSRYGLTGFADLLPQLAQAYREQGERFAEQNERLKAALALTLPEPPIHAAALPAAAPASLCIARAIVRPGRWRLWPARRNSRTRPSWTFACAVTPRHATSMRCAWFASRSRAWRRAASTTSWQADSRRYSVDGEWTIPHFEKMLYDNAALLALYADAWRATGEPRIRGNRTRDRGVAAIGNARTRRGFLFEPRRRQRARGRQVLRVDARSGEGGARSGTNTRSPHGTGAWTGPPNFEARGLAPASHGAARAGCPRALVTAARGRGASRGCARQAAGGARETRVRPGRDDKLLCSWNALMIAALARASRVFDEPLVALGRTAGDGLHPASDVARWAAARDVQGWTRAPERLSRRPRLLARGA